MFYSEPRKLICLQVSGKPGSNIFVLKKYRSKEAEENYNIETNGFTKLRSQTHTLPNIVGFHGSFVWTDTFNVILEYADRGDLKKFMQQNPPPSNGKDILTFWKQFFDLLRGLHTIHNAGGTDLDSQGMLGYVLIVSSNVRSAEQK